MLPTLIDPNVLNISRPDPRDQAAFNAFAEKVNIACANTSLKMDGIEPPTQEQLNARIVEQNTQAQDRIQARRDLVGNDDPVTRENIIDDILYNARQEVASYNVAVQRAIEEAQKKNTCFNGLPPKDATFDPPKAANDDPDVKAVIKNAPKTVKL